MKHKVIHKPLALQTFNTQFPIKTCNDTFKLFRLSLDPECLELFRFLTSSGESIISYLNKKLPNHGWDRVGITKHIKLCQPSILCTFFTKGVCPRRLYQHDWWNIFENECVKLWGLWMADLETQKTLEIRMADSYKRAAGA